MKYKTELTISKCKSCKDYDDTWDIECFCNNCKNNILNEVEK